MIHIAKDKSTEIEFCIPEIDPDDAGTSTWTLDIGSIEDQNVLLTKTGTLTEDSSGFLTRVIFTFTDTDTDSFSSYLSGYYDYVFSGGETGSESLLDKGTVIFVSTFGD